MANKEFKIQSNTVSLNGVPLSASADAKVVIPGITRSTGYRVEEVEDTGDQSHFFPTGGNSITVIDKVTFDIIFFNGDASNCADFSVELEDNGYIASIQVNGRGSYTAEQSTTNENNDMRAYIGSGAAGDRPIDPNDWLAIPFRPKMRSLGVESEFGGGGGASNLSDLNDVALDGPAQGQVLMWNNTQEVWENQNIPGGNANTGDILFDGNRIYVANGNDDILVDGVEVGVNLVSQDYAQLNYSSTGEPNSGAGKNTYVWADADGVTVQLYADASNGEYNHNWFFNSNGTLTLPAGGDIVDSNGTSVLGNGGGGSGSMQYAYVVSPTAYPIVDWTVDSPTYSVTVTGDASNDIDTIYGGWGYVSYEGTNTIRTVLGFNYDSGNNQTTITLNGLGDSNYNGANFHGVRRLENFNTITGGYGALDIVNGDLYVTGSSNHINYEMYNVTVNENGVVTMNTARGGIEFGAQPEEGAPQHLHIMRPAGQNGSTDLFFGDDYNFVKLPGLYGSGTQGVEIGSSFDGGSVSTWRFGTDGKLTLPNTAYIDSGTPTVYTEQDFSIGVGDTLKVWNFAQGGVLTLPAGGDIVDSTGTSVLGSGSGNSLAPELTKSGGNLVASTTLEFQGTMYGCFFDVDSGGNYDVWLQTVTGDGADMSYAIGSNDDNYNFVYAFNGNGTVSWKVGLDRITDNELTAYGIKYHNGSLYLVCQYYNNNLSRNQVAVVKLSAEDGSVELSWVLATNNNNNNVWWNPKDITVDSNNSPIVVGSVYGEAQTITGIAAQAGSTSQFLVVNAADISSSNIDPWGTYYVHTDPNDSNAWYQVENINTFRNLDTITLTGTGTGLTVNLRYTPDTNSSTGWRFDWCWIANGGSGYGGGDQVKILGSLIGGVDGVNDVILSHNGWYMNILSTDAGANNTQEIQSFVYNYTRFYTSQNVDYSGGNWDIRLGLNDNAFIWSPVWQHTYGKTNGEYFTSVAVDSDNNVYALGDFHDSSSGNNHRVMVMKLDSDGDQQWVKYVESNSYDGVPGSVAVDSNNNCIVISKDNNGYTLVTKLSTNGDVVWQSRQTNSNNWDNQPIGGVDSNNNIVLAGSWSANNNVTSIQKISGSDGSLVWARRFRNQQDYDMYEYYDEEAQAGKVVGNFIYYGGYCYDANDDQYVGFGFRLPTDGTGTGTYGRYIYSEDTDAYWEDNTSNAVLTTATYTAIDEISMSPQELGATTTADAVGSQIVHHYGIGTGGGMTGVDSIAFSDGSVQTTAYTGAETITWTNPNNNTWRIVTYNGGAGVYYNGDDTSACWFDAANSPLGDNQFRGAIIEYHAYTNNGTIIGTIHISADHWNNGTVTHTESMSGNSSVNTCEFWYTDNNRRLYFRRTDGNGNNAMIQWTARCFYGQENDC